MLIQYASDLHLEFLERRYSDARLIEPAPGAEVLILAGDIHHADRAVEVFGDWPCPVIYVAGNHESYGTDILKVHARIRERILARSGLQAFHFLENEAVVIGGVRFLGATLWTDYQLMDYLMTQAAAMRNAKVGLNDHRMIRIGGESFGPADALSLHWGSRTWLAQELDRKSDEKDDPGLEGFDTTVVVTHHGCHPQSCHPRYAGDPMNPAFVSNLRDLVVRADFWVHGHVHDSFDYAVGACRVMANPAGYVRNLGSALGPREFQQENPAFDPVKVFDTRQRDTLAGDARNAKEDS